MGVTKDLGHLRHSFVYKSSRKWWPVSCKLPWTVRRIVPKKHLLAVRLLTSAWRTFLSRAHRKPPKLLGEDIWTSMVQRQITSVLPIGQQSWKMSVTPVAEDAINIQLTCSRSETFKAFLNLTRMIARKPRHPLSPMVLTLYSTQLNRWHWPTLAILYHQDLW
jgi:hypothetical protein